MTVLVIDPRSAIPPFEQLRLQFLRLISSGELAPEARLPTVRKLASDLGVAPNTVARTYRELESAGLIETRGRHGSFVAKSADPVLRQAETAAAQFADQMRQLQLSTADALRLVVAALPADPEDVAGPGATPGAAPVR
ncbi:MAG: GntR family transcriptional regulator [Actinomycetota bacterium]